MYHESTKSGGHNILCNPIVFKFVKLADARLTQQLAFNSGYLCFFFKHKTIEIVGDNFVPPAEADIYIYNREQVPCSSCIIDVIHVLHLQKYFNEHPNLIQGTKN